MSFKEIPLEWDSSFFGYPISKIVLQGTTKLDGFNNDIVKEALAELVYIYCDKTQLPYLSNTIKPAFVENKVTYQMPISGVEGNDRIAMRRVSDFENINDIYYLSLEAGKYSRFRLDANMKNFEFEKLYFEWVYKSISGRFDHDVFLYIENSKPIGLLTLKVANDTAHIGLISSHRDYQGRGIGKNMIAFAKNYSALNKCKFLSVATQESNDIAMKFYKKNGFSIYQVDCILHAWRRDQK